MAHYLISEASRKLNVEAHVLRYWEEELKLEIPRNELGHRYYTEKQLALFQKIKELKELGYQLKAIRTSLNQEGQAEPKADEAGFLLEEDRETETETAEADKPVSETEPRFTVLDGTERFREESGSPDPEGTNTEEGRNALSVEEKERHGSLATTPEKLEQFQAIMTDVLAEALRRNHESFSSEVGGRISDKVVKEMNYLMREREEREEERYRKLDETIRAAQRLQKQKSEAAVTKVPERKTGKKRFGFRRKK